MTARRVLHTVAALALTVPFAIMAGVVVGCWLNVGAR
jgi:hypothetical protein